MSLTFITPAYGLHSPEQVITVEKNAQRLTEALNKHQKTAHTPHFSPLTSKPVGHGNWHPLAERIDDLTTLWNSSYWWAARGGFGCIHLIPWLLQQQVPGPSLIGYSDITALHAVWAQQNWGESYYACMPAAPFGPQAIASLLADLNGHKREHNEQTHPAVCPLRSGTAQGPLFAGCLRVLASLAGTAAFPNLNGHILCIEDIDERPYACDRDLHQLFLAGHLDGIVGLVVGEMRCSEPANGGPSMDTISSEWGKRLTVPVISGFPFGHVDDPLSIPIGRIAELMVCKPQPMQHTTEHNWTLVFQPRISSSRS